MRDMRFRNQRAAQLAVANLNLLGIHSLAYEDTHTHTAGCAMPVSSPAEDARAKVLTSFSNYCWCCCGFVFSLRDPFQLGSTGK